MGRPAAAAVPVLPDDIEADQLDRGVRAELESLARHAAETVARHLVATGRLIDEDPTQALAHAVAARRLASRISAVREAVGLAAYRAGEWQTAVAELRTYHRMSGRNDHLAVLADCERALGRPERAIDIFRTTPRDELDQAEAVELLIVAAGARRDLEQFDAAVSMLQVRELAEETSTPWAARLRYAFADALLAAGRGEEAREWFARAAEADEDAVTDAAERLLALDGVSLAEAEEPDETGTAEIHDSGGPAEIDDPAVADGSAEAVAEPVGYVATGDRDDSVTPVAPVAPPAAPKALIDGYDLVVLDLDGVVYLGDEAVPGAVDAINQLRRDGPTVVYATNNASRGAEEVAAALTRLGVEAAAGDVVTSAMAAAQVLRQRLSPGAPVLVVGAEALMEEVRKVGLRPVSRADEDPAAVVQGYGPAVGWPELAEACVAIRAGAQWVATNTDATLPTLRGALPGNGALVAALSTALAREPDLVVGKPQPALFEAAAQRVDAGRVLVVGDRLDTDTAGAAKAGMDSLLVLTGVNGADDVRSAPPHQRPTYLGADLTALFAPPVRA